MEQDTFGGIKGMTDSDVRQAYAKLAAERDALRAALAGMVAQCEALNAQVAFGQDYETARAALAQGE